LAEVAWVLTDVEEVNGVVVTRFVDEGVVDVGVFPCLGDLRDVSEGVFAQKDFMGRLAEP
jgi:hypothetical protein